MIGSDIGNLKSMLSNVFTKAAEARDKANGKTGDADAKKAAAAPPRIPPTRLSCSAPAWRI